MADQVNDLDALDQVAEDAAGVIRAATPHGKTGRLSAGVRAGRAKGKAYVANAAPYAGAINYGWQARNIAARHYMQAADGSTQQAATVKRLEDDIDHEIRLRGLN